MTEQVINILILSVVVPIGLLLITLALLYTINKLPVSYKIKIRANILEAKFYFLKNKGKDFIDHFEMWHKILDEALKSDLNESEIYEFISNYFDRYIFVKSSGDVFTKDIFSKDEIIRISQDYIKNSKLLSSNI